MKKLLFSCLVLGNTIVVFGQQTTIDFENFTLSQADTFYNGSDMSNGFSNSFNGNTISFSNEYNANWESWNGFSYSNVVNTTTAGYGNQYAAFTGQGANQSEKYAVFYPSGIISFANPTFVDSMKVTNTTFAAISMRDGDAYGKQFGSLTNAAGDNDGTNGEDFLRVWFISMNEGLDHLDSVEFYLADYRFADNSQDYILSSWKNVNLTSLGSIKFLTMRFESSDMSGIYINTPTYLALDDIHLTNLLSVDENSIDFTVYPNPVNDILHINAEFDQLNILSLDGKQVFSTSVKTSKIDLSTLSLGVYQLQLIKDGDSSFKTIYKN